MIISSLDIAHFGKLKNVHISLKEGVNIITGENESGKTTIAFFIKGMLYGIPEGSSVYARYLPYDFDGTFGGSMEIGTEGQRLRIERSFSEGTLRITDSAGEEIEDPEACLKEILNGMTEEDYLSTGFLSQNGFRMDDDRFKETEEKNALKKKEEALKERFEAAKEYLIRERDGITAELDPSLDETLLKSEEENAENDGRILELSRVIPEKEAQAEKEEQDLETEIRETEEANREKESSLKNGMINGKSELSEEVARKNALGNARTFSGTIPLILGVILGLASWAYAWWRGFTWQEDLVLPVVLIGSASFVLLTLFGLIALVRKNSEMKKLEASEKRLSELRKAAEEKENAYQYFLKHREEEERKVEDPEGRRKLIAELKEEAETLLEELKERQERDGGLKEALKDLRDKKEVQDRKLYELEAVKLSLQAVIEAGRLEDEGDGLSDGATAYLSRLNEMADEKISVEPEEMIHVNREGKNIAVGDLSTAAAQEVLLSVRLSMLDARDPEKRLPVILDDIFANFDADRLSAGIRLLKELDRQVILLSCQTRERGSL